MSQKNNENVRLLVRLAVLCALAAVATIVIAIPIPNLTGAYVNAGDAVVYTCAYILGGGWGALAAGLGSAAADLILGSALYAPATLLIKGLMAFVAGKIMARGSASLKGRLAALLVGGIIMPLGYFLYETILYGVGPAAAGLPFNLIQYAGGIVLGILLIQALDRIMNHKREA